MLIQSLEPTTLKPGQLSGMPTMAQISEGRMFSVSGELRGKIVVEGYSSATVGVLQLA